MASSRSDHDLLQAWRDGDKTAGGVLFDRHFDRLARFFVNKVSEGVDDLVQQTFMGAIEARDRFRGDAQFKTFLLRIAHNILCKHYRSKRVRNQDPDFSVTAVADLGPSPSMVVAKAAEQQLVLVALRKIPLDSQVVLELTFWERLTGAEVAEVLDLPVGTAKTRIRRAKQLLGQQLEALSSAPELLESTRGNLDAWAASLRELALPPESSPSSDG